MSVLDYLRLPPEISDFERRYLARVNRIGLYACAAFVAVTTLVAWANGTGPLLALTLGTLALVGPVVAMRTQPSPRTHSIVLGATSMVLGGLLVHFGQGPLQIEMHFAFFVLIALLAVFANPMVVLVAAATVAAHHAVVYVAAPRSVFNYQAAWWVVAVHALFVVIESVAACFVARSFFDNVIGLERIVTARTAEVTARNADMRRVLDAVTQGFVTITADGTLSPERSAAFERWFPTVTAGSTWFECLATRAPSFAERSKLAWDEVVAGFMPIELTLDQMPREFEADGAHYRVEYRPIGASEPYERFLVVMTDVSDEVARAQVEAEHRETMVVLERALVDRNGVTSFFEEAAELLKTLDHASTPMAVLQRNLHTLKGNASLFGLATIASKCHALEDLIVRTGEAPNAAQIALLRHEWERASRDAERLLGRPATVEFDEEQYAALLELVRTNAASVTILRWLRDRRMEPTQRRLAQFADQARTIAEKLQKPDLTVVIEDSGVRLDARRWRSFWGAFVHAVRNAIDHGIETPDEREEIGKPAGGRIWLRTRSDAHGVVVEVQDDGRGVNWNRLREKALAAGLPANTNDELTRAMFTDAVSTAESVTEVSGRGVGMGALLDATRALGGEVSVHSTPGVGTTVRMSFPVSASRPLESLKPAAA